MQKFDLFKNELEGTNLIEASAGTGKTYTITGLFLRLILEKHLSVDQILVVTFTKAATEELKDRIRTRLRDALDAFSEGQSKDEFLNTLIERDDDPKSGIRHLKQAIRDFDEAAIFTIHSFCKRMLHDNAFESGSLFDTELVADHENLKQEIVEDFWRKHFYNESRLFINYILDKKITPEKLLAFLGNKIAHPYLKIIPQPDDMSDVAEVEKHYKACFDPVQEAWSSVKTEIRNILDTDKGLNRTKYKKTSIPKWFPSMDDYMAVGNNNPVSFKEFEKFTSSCLQKAVRKNHTAPAHPFFDLCELLKDKQETLIKIFEKRLMRLKIELFQYVKDELEKRKEIRNILSFDDLLSNLQRGIQKGGESRLM